MKIFIVFLAVILLSSCGYEKSDSEIAAEPPSQNTARQSGTEKSNTQSVQTVPAETQPTQSEKTLASAYTELLDKTPDRVENINIACGAINGTTLYPWGSFSFNESVGRRSEANGYRDAKVIVNGHSEQGCGGGVCQVSSTLYMAAKDANLQIDERHPHSHGVAYAPDGNDATVVYGEKDLKFTNNTDNIIILYIWTDGSGVFSEIVQKPLDNSDL